MSYPLIFTPIHKERIWGGRKLADKYNRELPTDKTGESWEISCHENGTSTIKNGVLAGTSLIDAIKNHGVELLGQAVYDEDYKKFPLLIKILDAADVLSVQVHPDDNYAFVNENGELGKTEMWYIIEAKPGAKLVFGVKPGVSRVDFENKVREGSLEDCLREVEVQSGDVLFIPAGMVHAIGEGILICEIQQNSDTTYRVYDWNRLDDKANPRELHIEKALEVIDFDGKHKGDKLQGLTLTETGGKRTIYVACKYFAMEKLSVNGEMDVSLDGERFQLLTCVEGSAVVDYIDAAQKETVALSSGVSCLIPAALQQVSVNGDATIIRAYVPNKEENIIKPLMNKGYNKKDLEAIAGLFD